MNESRDATRLPDELPPDPMHWADAWLKEAEAAEIQRNPNAMTLVTVSADGRPSARVVLCKAFVPDPGYVVFYTNYRSRKALEIADDDRVAAVFHWDAWGRQIRLEGRAVRAPEEESDRYFASRDVGAQIGAWGSDQSMEIESRAALIEQIRGRARGLGVSIADDGSVVASGPRPVLSRPPYWGGYRLWATAIELWLEGADRIHDRARWRREIVRVGEHRFTVTPWAGKRLQP